MQSITQRKGVISTTDSADEGYTTVSCEVGLISCEYWLAAGSDVQAILSVDFRRRWVRCSAIPRFFAR